MGVGDKCVGNLEKLGRPAIYQLSHIKEQSPPFPENFDVKPGVLKSVVEELGLEKRFQGSGSCKKDGIPTCLRKKFRLVRSYETAEKPSTGKLRSSPSFFAFVVGMKAWIGRGVAPRLSRGVEMINPHVSFWSLEKIG